MMKKTIGLFLLAVVLTWGQLQVTSTSPGRVQIRMDAPPAINLLASHTDLNLSSIYTEAFMIGEPGGPALPRYRIVVGVPPEGEVNVTYSLGESRELNGVKISPYHSPGIGPQPEPSVFWADTLKSVKFYITRWRALRVAVIEITPLRYDAHSRKLTLYEGVTVNVSFTNLPQSSITQPSLDPAEEIYAATVVNYEQSKNWRFSVSAPPPSPFQNSDHWIEVKIPQDGVYQIRFKDLKKLGIDPKGFDPRTLRILYAAKQGFEDPIPDTLTELPLYVHGEEDGSFDRQDYIVFFARGANRWDFEERKFETNPYVRENVYLLTWGQGQGRRMRTRSTYPLSDDVQTTAKGVLHFEEDHECPGRSGILWLWKAIKKSTVTAVDSLSLDLSGVSSIDTFTFRAYADTAGVGFRLLVEEDTLYYTESALTGTGVLPDYTVVSPDMVISKDLKLVIEVFGAGQKELFPDLVRIVGERELSLKYAPFWVELSGQGSYEFEDIKSAPFLVDLSDPSDPVMLTDWRLENGKLSLSPRVSSKIPLWVSEQRRLLIPELEATEPGKLWNEDWNVDYLVLSTDENYEAALAFVEYRSENLHLPSGSPRAKAVKLSDIVRDFGYGIAEPQAVRHFLSYAYQKGEGRPFYVLILGDGMYDYKNNLNFTGRPEYFPIYTTGYVLDPNVYTHVGAAIEPWFVDFDEIGQEPEMAMGRITARDPREAYSVLDKIKEYESQSYDAWHSRLLLLSDDDYMGTPSDPDYIKNHISANEAINEILYPELDPMKVYLSDYTLVGGKKPDAKEALFEALDQGALLWFFFGHGNGMQLTHEAVLENTDVPSLNNGNKLPLGLFFSCGVGRFEDTRWECVAEELARSDVGGTIASIAATKATGDVSNEKIATMLAEDFRDLKNPNIGDLFFHISPQNELYVLLGDPAVPLLFPTTRTFDPGSVEFATGDTTVVSLTAPIDEGEWFSSAYGTWQRRTSELYGHVYYSKGELLYRARGELSSNEQTLRFIVPQDITVGDSAYLFVLCANDDSIYTYRLDSVNVIEGAATSSDLTGPSVQFYVNGSALTDGDTLPPSFDLTVDLEDPSGVNLAGKTGLRGPAVGQKLSIVVNNGDAVDLAPYFEYEVTADALATMGSATVPLYLSSEENSIILYGVDNLRNTSKEELTVYASMEHNLEIKDPLVYPNPVSSAAEFTFELNAAAKVTIQIFTVSGRLVRQLPSVSYPAGFGTYPWDGLDVSTRSLPNGVYIYRLTAETGSDDAWLPDARTSVNEKFIVVH